MDRTSWRGMAAALLIGCLCASGCSPGARPAPSPAPDGAAREDSALFAAVLEAVETTPARPLRVDPRPLRPEPSVLEPAARTLASVPPRVLEARSAVLRRRGIPTTDAVADIACAIGNLRVDDPAAPDTARLAACAGRTRILSVIASLPRGGAPPGFDAGAAGAAGGAELRTVRVFHISVDPRFGSHAAYDYVFARGGPGAPWVLLGRHAVFIAG